MEKFFRTFLFFWGFMTMVGIKAEKAALRKTLLAERKLWLDQQPNGSRVHTQLAAKIATILVEGKYTKVLGFWPFGAEPDFRALYQTLMKDPKVTFALPTVDPITPALHFIATTDEDQLSATPPYGILEPSYSPEAVVAADQETLILVPALAIDACGFRLGYGGGYYDRYLAAHPDAKAVGTVFSPFYPRWLPTSDHDISVSYVVTERQLSAIAPQ